MFVAYETLQCLVQRGHDNKDKEVQSRVRQLISSCAVCQKTRLGQPGFVPTIRTTAIEQPFAHYEWDTIVASTTLRPAWSPGCDSVMLRDGSV